MRHLKLYEDHTPSHPNATIEGMLPAYTAACSPIEEIGQVNGVRVVAVSRTALKGEHPEWGRYLGSHHWGKQTPYIPQDAIWVAQGLSPAEFVRVVHHELLERPMMRELQTRHGLTREESWDIAHPIVKSKGF